MLLINLILTIIMCMVVYFFVYGEKPTQNVTYYSIKKPEIIGVVVPPDPSRKVVMGVLALTMVLGTAMFWGLALPLLRLRKPPKGFEQYQEEFFPSETGEMR